MGKTSYLLNWTDEEYDAAIVASKREGISVAALLRRAIRWKLGITDATESDPDAGYIYIFSDGMAHKIGSSADPKRRKTQLQVSNPRDIETVLLFDCPFSKMGQIEAALHEHFKNQRLRGEWFNLSASDVEWIRVNIKQFI